MSKQESRLVPMTEATMSTCAAGAEHEGRLSEFAAKSENQPHQEIRAGAKCSSVPVMKMMKLTLFLETGSHISDLWGRLCSEKREKQFITAQTHDCSLPKYNPAAVFPVALFGHKEKYRHV